MATEAKFVKKATTYNRPPDSILQQTQTVPDPNGRFNLNVFRFARTAHSCSHLTKLAIILLVEEMY
jgi:hypothetical protein